MQKACDWRIVASKSAEALKVEVLGRQQETLAVVYFSTTEKAANLTEYK